MCRPASFTLMHLGLLFQMLRVSNEQHPLRGLKFEISCEIYTRRTIIEHICRTLCQTRFCGHLLTLFLLPVVTISKGQQEHVDMKDYIIAMVILECFVSSKEYIRLKQYILQHSDSDSQLCIVTLFNKHCSITEIKLI